MMVKKVVKRLCAEGLLALKISIYLHFISISLPGFEPLACPKNTFRSLYVSYQ